MKMFDRELRNFEITHFVRFPICVYVYCDMERMTFK